MNRTTLATVPNRCMSIGDGSATFASRCMRMPTGRCSRMACCAAAIDFGRPTVIDMHRFGTVANVVRFITAPDGTHHLVCQGEQRFQVEEFLGGWPFFVAGVA